MKIYTKAGDQGETGLLGGRRVSKASPRIEAYGTVDELSAALGVVLTQLGGNGAEASRIVKKIQNELHIVCADLAAPDLSNGKIPRIEAKHVEQLEKLCDELEEELPPLERFVLPGGTPAGALLHWARTVARRAERRVVELAAHEEINAEVVRYLNRLSDLLFLLARWVNHRGGVEESHPSY
jgi:cob(I)alamin adenosyltransferase